MDRLVAQPVRRKRPASPRWGGCRGISSSILVLLWSGRRASVSASLVPPARGGPHLAARHASRGGSSKGPQAAPMDAWSSAAGPWSISGGGARSGGAEARGVVGDAGEEQGQAVLSVRAAPGLRGGHDGRENRGPRGGLRRGAAPSSPADAPRRPGRGRGGAPAPGRSRSGSPARARGRYGPRAVARRRRTPSRSADHRPHRPAHLAHRPGGTAGCRCSLTACRPSRRP